MIHAIRLRPSILCLSVALGAALPAAFAQVATAVSSPARQSGTVKATDASSITVTTNAGAEVKVSVAPGASVLKVPADSKDIKSALPGTMADVSVGDRVIIGKAGDTVTASRVILMKSTDIAALKQSQQMDWQRRGVGGLVKATDGPVLTITAGTRTVKVETTPATIFRRYATDSVNFADAKPGMLDQVHAGDQLSVRGTRSEDGSSITAEEVVTGTFTNASGTLTAVNAAAGTITLKDLLSKKTLTIAVTPKSDLRKLPQQAAAAFAARNAPGAAGSSPGAGSGANPGAGSGANPGAGSGGGNGRPGGAVGPGPRAPNAEGTAGGTGGGNRRPGGADAAGAGAMGGGAAGAGGGMAGPRSAGMDLSRMLARLPELQLADLKTGDAVMIVASETGSSNALTTITLLSGVEQLLSATPSGAQPITLSPWSLGAPEGGGGPQ